MEGNSGGVDRFRNSALPFAWLGRIGARPGNGFIRKVERSQEGSEAKWQAASA